MKILQVREKEIFETLKRISKYSFVVIGGYAVNAYTLPRFSVDCDIVVKDVSESYTFGKELSLVGYFKAKDQKIDYGGAFIRYEKEIKNNILVSVNILIGEVSDRLSGAKFTEAWIFKNSSLGLLPGKTISEELRIRIISIDALLTMKICSCRSTDIRDVFMLLPNAKSFTWIKDEVAKRCNFKERIEIILKKVSDTRFKNNLQGVYGYIDHQVYNKHLKAIELLMRD